MIPFRNSLPYDIVMQDVYVQECPFCGASHILLPMKPEEIRDLRGGGGRKRAIVFPCCHTRVRFVDADSDYLMADRAVRGG